MYVPSGKQKAYLIIEQELINWSSGLRWLFCDEMNRYEIRNKGYQGRKSKQDDPYYSYTTFPIEYLDWTIFPTCCIEFNLT